MKDPEEDRMRELAGSMMRMSWAMSMLGVKGAVDLVSPERGWRRSAAAMEAVRESAEAELGEEAGSFYRAGERLQASVLDGVSQVGRGEVLRPDRFLRGASEILKHSADMVAKATAATATTSPSDREPGEE